MSRIKRNVRLRVESLEGRRLLSSSGLLDTPPSPDLLTNLGNAPDYGSSNSGSSSSGSSTPWYAQTTQNTGGGTAAAPFVAITPPGQNSSSRNWTVDANGDVTQTGPLVSSARKPNSQSSPPPKAPTPTVSLIVKVGGGMQAVGGGIQG